MWNETSNGDHEYVPAITAAAAARASGDATDPRWAAVAPTPDQATVQRYFEIVELEMHAEAERERVMRSPKTSSGLARAPTAGRRGAERRGRSRRGD